MISRVFRFIKDCLQLAYTRYFISPITPFLGVLALLSSVLFSNTLNKLSFYKLSNGLWMLRKPSVLTLRFFVIHTWLPMVISVDAPPPQELTIIAVNTTALKIKLTCFIFICFKLSNKLTWVCRSLLLKQKAIKW